MALFIVNILDKAKMIELFENLGNGLWVLM